VGQLKYVKKCRYWHKNQNDREKVNTRGVLFFDKRDVLFEQLFAWQLMKQPWIYIDK